MTNAIRDREFDDYPIQPVDTSLSAEERERQKAEADRKLEETIQRALKEID